MTKPGTRHNNKIFRTQLKILDYQEITINANSSLLSVAPARDTYKHESGYPGGHIDVQGIDLWYINRPEMDPNFPELKKLLGIYVIGTGNPIPNAIGTSRTHFLGTCVMSNDLVWHVFEGPLHHEQDVTE